MTRLSKTNLFRCWLLRLSAVIAEKIWETISLQLAVRQREEAILRAIASVPNSACSVMLQVLTEVVCTVQLVNCGLSNITIEALSSRGITSLFPIQKHVYEPAAAGRDLIGRARTGSGKTLAFALPVVEKLLQVELSRIKIYK